MNALRFRFLHFEGTYAYVNRVRYWKQCRVVRNDGRVQSVGDAAGFSRVDWRGLRFRRTGAKIYHYGWARAPKAAKREALAVARVYRDNRHVASHAKHVRPQVLQRFGYGVPFLRHSAGSESRSDGWHEARSPGAGGRRSTRPCCLGGSTQHGFAIVESSRASAHWTVTW